MLYKHNADMNRVNVGGKCGYSSTKVTDSTLLLPGSIKVYFVPISIYSPYNFNVSNENIVVYLVR